MSPLLVSTMLALGVRVMLALTVLLRGLEQLIGPAVPLRVLEKIEVGMLQNRVQEIMGQPKRIRLEGSGEVWVYSRVGNVGYVDIRFDDRRVVWGVNDESALGAGVSFVAE